MNELDLPTPPPLPAEVRERALNTVLSEIDAPPRRRTAPLVAAAVVVMVLGAATATALSRSPSTEPSELAVPPRPAASWIVAPPPVEPEVPATPPSSDPAPPDTRTGYVDPFVRCKAAVTGSGRADEYPDVAGWAAPEYLQTWAGVDVLLAIDNAFVCFVTPTTVRVSQTAGIPVGDVEVVRVGPGKFGVLNPNGASVSWSIGTNSSQPDTAAVQAIQLDDGVAPADVQLTVVGPGSTEPLIEPLPDSAPDPMIVATDRPLPPRDSTTVDGAALDDCVGATTQDESVPGLARLVAGESEHELWQPVERFDLPGGGYAISATIGGDYIGLCVRTGDRRHWFGRHFPSDEQQPIGLALISAIPSAGVGMWGLGTDVVSVDLRRADGTSVPCKVRSRMALCAGDDARGPLTITLIGSDGVAVQAPVSLEAE